MSNRTIKAPGVEIFEHDMSEYPAISEGTHVLIAGFAQKGEDYEPYRLTSRSSWLKFYGAPTNEAEEYFYAAANRVIDEGGYLHSVKIPYSNDIKGIYAAAKFKIEECRDLLERDPESGDYFMNLDGTPNTEIDNGTDAARLMDQYSGLKKLGINHISKIAPQAQDFLSYDLVEEFETGESKPGDNTIYIVDKTRAIYTRAVKVNDTQPNRDARACLGIVPVISTLANTAWFQKQSTGLTADINELYQPIRSLKTITFPAGAASAAEYQPTVLSADSYTEEVVDKKTGKVKTQTTRDLTVDIIKPNNSYDRSLSEMVAMQAQSCLVNGNMVNGKFAPFVCNEIAVVVLKAFISTEDSRIDFEVVESWTGSLDPDARDEKGRANYIGTLINNNSDYIYFFSNLKHPKTVLKNDHAFVAGSNTPFREVEDKIKDDLDYLAAKTFGGYTARMLGFDDNLDRSEDMRRSMDDTPTMYKSHVYHSLNSFYNQNDKEKVAITDTIVYGGDFSYDEIVADIGTESWDEKNDAVWNDPENEVASGLQKVLRGVVTRKEDDELDVDTTTSYVAQAMKGRKIIVSDKFITKKPSCIYRIGRDPDKPQGENSIYGMIRFLITSPKSDKQTVNENTEWIRKWEGEKASYVPEEYDRVLQMGRVTGAISEECDKLVKRGDSPSEDDLPINVFNDVKLSSYDLPDSISGEDFFQLTIFNSTDYLRAIRDFEDLVDIHAIQQVSNAPWGKLPDGEDGELKPETLQYLRDIMTRMLIVNSMEKTARWKVYLRKLKKDQAAIDRLDDTMATFVDRTTAVEYGPYTSRIYIRDLYRSLFSMGAIDGISIVENIIATNSSGAAGLAAKVSTVEKKLEDAVNPDTTKGEKAVPSKRTGKKDTTSDNTTGGGSASGADPAKIILKLTGNWGKEIRDPDTGKVILAKNTDNYIEMYIKCRIYLMHRLYEDYKAMYAYICDVLDDCAMAADRYLQTQQSIDDSNIMLGFYPEMAEPIITYTEIAQTINKLYDTFGDLNSTTIDVVCDAGLSNIAQFVKQVYDPSSEDGEDIGGCYEPVKNASWFKFNKNTDLSYWKTIVFKWNTFCKSIRKDCMFCTEAPRHLVLSGNKPVVRKSKKDTSVDINILPYLTMITGFNTSYGAGYMNWYKTVSDYTGDILWIPPSIIAAGTYILTDRDYNWWDAPAGHKRGVVDMADVSFNPTNKQAGEIYDVSWNYAINYKGNYINGIIQEGQKTFQSYHSAFDRINVRRLFLRCERYVYFASRAFLYEPNTALTRQRYVDAITPFFDDIKQRGGMYDYIIICDESNNTPDTIDRNELRVKIGIQPVKTIEFILVDFVATRTGSDWSELASI